MSKKQLTCLAIWLCVFAITGILLFDKKNDAILRIKINDVGENEIRVKINGCHHADIVNPEKNPNSLYIPVKLDKLVCDDTIKLRVDKGAISSFKLMSSLGFCKFDILSFDIKPAKSVNIPISKVGNAIATLNLFLLLAALIVASLVVSAICLIRHISVNKRVLRCCQQLAVMADGMARRLSSIVLQRIYLVVLSLPLLAAALFTVIYLSFFVYGLWHGHAMPSAEMYFAFPGVGRLLASKGHISNACMAWAILGYFLSQVTRKGAPQAAPLEAPLLRVMRILALPMCVSIVLALQGAAVFFAHDAENIYFYYNNAISGIVPSYDSNSHYCHCLQYFVTGVMPDWVLKRPLAALLGSALLGIGGGNPVVTIMLRCILNGVAIWFFTCAVTRHYGIWTGVAATGLAVCFLAPYPPTFLTEVLGFIWACLAVALWLEALHNRSLLLELAALTSTGLGLLTRMGAMFLLPMFALYVVWKWKWHSPDGVPHSIVRLCATVGLVAALLALANAGGMRLGNAGRQMTGANFADCFAGLSIGTDYRGPGKKYASELSALSTSAERSAFLYRMAIANIREKPAIFLDRLWQGEKAFWKELPKFISHKGTPILCMFCILLAWRWRRRDVCERRFWLVFWLGVAVSIPFIYFDDSWRVNIVAYPFMAVFIAMAIAVPQKSLTTTAIYFFSPLAKCVVSFATLLLLLMIMTAVWPRLFPMRAAKAAAAFAHLPLEKDEVLMLGDGNAAGMLVVDDDTPCTSGKVWKITRTSLKKVLCQRNYRSYRNILAVALPETPFAFMSCPVSGTIVVAPPSLLLKNNVLLWKVAIAPLKAGRRFYIVTSAVPVEMNGNE